MFLVLQSSCNWGRRGVLCPFLVFHHPCSMGPICLAVFWSPNSHPSVQCPRHWKIPTLFSLAPKRCQSKQFRITPQTSVNVPGKEIQQFLQAVRWWCKHEDAKRISRVCLYHLSEDKGLREVTKRTTEWKPGNSLIKMEFYVNAKHIWEALS